MNIAKPFQRKNYIKTKSMVPQKQIVLLLSYFVICFQQAEELLRRTQKIKTETLNHQKFDLVKRQLQINANQAENLFMTRFGHFQTSKSQNQKYIRFYKLKQTPFQKYAKKFDYVSSKNETPLCISAISQSNVIHRPRINTDFSNPSTSRTQFSQTLQQFNQQFNNYQQNKYKSETKINSQNQIGEEKLVKSCSIIPQNSSLLERRGICDAIQSIYFKLNLENSNFKLVQLDQKHQDELKDNDKTEEFIPREIYKSKPQIRIRYQIQRNNANKYHIIVK